MWKQKNEAIILRSTDTVILLSNLRTKNSLIREFGYGRQVFAASVSENLDLRKFLEHWYYVIGLNLVYSYRLWTEEVIDIV